MNSKAPTVFSKNKSIQEDRKKEVVAGSFIISEPTTPSYYHAVVSTTAVPTLPPVGFAYLDLVQSALQLRTRPHG
jgi:hypothetical protein